MIDYKRLVIELSESTLTIRPMMWDEKVGKNCWMLPDGVVPTAESADYLLAEWAKVLNDNPSPDDWDWEEFLEEVLPGIETVFRDRDGTLMKEDPWGDITPLWG